MPSYSELPKMTHLESLCAEARRDGGYYDEYGEVSDYAVTVGLKEFRNVPYANSRMSRDKRMRYEARELRALMKPQVKEKAAAMGLGFIFFWFVLPGLLKFLAWWLVRKWYSEARINLQAAQRELLDT